MNRDLEQTAPRRRPPYFWWLLANVLALCFAVLSWIFCLEVFGNPDVPRNYQILAKLGRLPKIKDFKGSTLPEGSLHGPRELYRKFFDVTDDQFAELNRQYLRNHLTNFDDPLGVTYIEGDFVVQEVRACGPGDYLYGGFVIRSRARVKPDDFSKAVPYPVVVEYLFPTTDASAMESFAPGQVISIGKAPHAGVVLDAGKHLEGDEQVVRFTVMPLIYGPCRMGGKPFVLVAPDKLRPAARFPCFGQGSAVANGR